MKTAEEISRQIYDECHSPVMGRASVPPDFIRAIQLDAARHGMTLAGQIAHKALDDRDISTYASTEIYRRITAARDRLTAEQLNPQP